MQPITIPQVPGGSDSDANDGRQISGRARGEKNLRVAVSNHQTTSAIPLDSDQASEQNEKMINSQTMRYNLRKRKININNQAHSTNLKQYDQESTSSSRHSLFTSPSSSPNTHSLISRSDSLSTYTQGLEDVMQTAPAVNSASTTGQSRTRKKWTTDMNEFIWRTYLTITCLETKNRGYLDLLHKKFNEKFKDFDVSKQRVGMQRRAIVKNKLLQQSILDEIRQDVERNTHVTNSTKQSSTQNTEPVLTTSSTRIRWADDINEAIIRTYFKITNLESNKTSYRKLLHVAITQQFPQISHLSEQRIADQRRSIIHNKLLSAEKIEEIRNEVKQTLPIMPLSNEHNLHSPPSQFEITNKSQRFSTNVTQPLHNYNNERGEYQTAPDFNVKIEETFKSTHEKFINTDPTTRPFIPKQKTSKRLTYIVQYLDKNILPQFMTADTDFITMQTIIYCAAYSAAVSVAAAAVSVQN